jgi:hypothetical protein
LLRDAAKRNRPIEFGGERQAILADAQNFTTLRPTYAPFNGSKLSIQFDRSVSRPNNKEHKE